MTTMHTEWTDQLSDYLDEELTADARRAVEAHLAGCADCRAVLDELQQVVARARTIEPRPPDADLWPAVAQRIDRVSARRVSFTLPQALAATLVIALLSGAVVWQVMGSPKGPRYDNTMRAASDPVAQGSSPTPDRLRADVATVSFADAQYDAAVADLERALKEGRGRLDQATIDTVEHNLQIIDRAIDQARQALDDDPANSYLSSHLVEARRRKLDLLRRAAALTEGD
jgi:putative zinc finger protein